MGRKPRILVVGSFVMDVIATTERLPQAGQAVYGNTFRMAPGGKGANQALQCARLGADVTMMGCVGRDIFGEKLLEVPRAAGVDVSRVCVKDGVSSGVGHIVLEVTGQVAQNRIIVIPGANRCLEMADVAWIEKEVSSYDMVLLQLEVPLEINRAVAGWAKAAGVPVMLNPAPATELDDVLLSLVSYLAPNEQEASVESGLPLNYDQNGEPILSDLEKIGGELTRRGAEKVLITLGANGSAVVEQGRIHRLPSVHMDRVEDPTGAGDSFVAAFCVGLTVGLSRDEAITFASYASAITVSRMGAMPSLPTLDEVLDLLRERGGQGFDLCALDVLR